MNKIININWNDGESIKSAEKTKMKLENSGYVFDKIEKNGLSKDILFYRRIKE